MARFLFASTPVAAHSATPRPIVRRLVERGHDVIRYAGAADADAIRATGARYAPLLAALDVSRGDPCDWFPHLRELDGMAAVKAMYRELHLAQIEPVVADLERLLEDFPVDVLVTNALLGRTANVVMERGGPVNALLGDAPLPPPVPDQPLDRIRNRFLAVPRRWALRDLNAEYNALRGRLALPPDTRWLFDAGGSRFLHLQGTVPELEHPRHDHDPQVHFVGPFHGAASRRRPTTGGWQPRTLNLRQFWLDRYRNCRNFRTRTRPDPPAHWRPPAWWHELDGHRPVVHVAQATIRADAAELLRLALEALAREDVLVVATTGAVDPDAVAPLPPNVRIAPFVPDDELLDKTDVFVTDGGYVGTNLALAHGVPVLVVGAGEEAAEVGARVAAAGVGCALRTRRPSPAAMREAVHRVLDGPGYHQAAALVARSMAGRDATATAVELLERLAHDQRPVPRGGARVVHAARRQPDPAPGPNPAPERVPVGDWASPAGMASPRDWAAAVTATTDASCLTGGPRWITPRIPPDPTPGRCRAATRHRPPPSRALPDPRREPPADPRRAPPPGPGGPGTRRGSAAHRSPGPPGAVPFHWSRGGPWGSEPPPGGRGASGSRPRSPYGLTRQGHRFARALRARPLTRQVRCSRRLTAGRGDRAAAQQKLPRVAQRAQIAA